MKQNYVTAVLELLQTDMSTEVVLRNLETVLADRGHSKLLPSILLSLLGELSRLNKSAVATVVLAKENSVEESAISEALKKLSAPTTGYTVKINPKVIGGFVVTYQSKEIDQSYQTKLRELYQSIITA